METITRPELALPDAVRLLRDVAASRGVPGGLAAARALAADRVRWQRAEDAILAAPSAVVLGRVAEGPVLAGRRIDLDEVTAVHDHGVAGAVLAVRGRVRYERFTRGGRSRVRRESLHDLAPGDTFWWGAPPDDVHRLTGLADGTIVLLLTTGEPRPGPTLREVPEERPALCAAVEDAWLAGDVAQLHPLYHPEVLADIGVPDWRFQVRGREEVLQLLAEEEFERPDRRVHELRTTPTTDGVIVEAETRWSDDGQTWVNREAHHLRCRHGLVVEHVVWCTGVVDAAQAAEQLATAPMERA